MTQSAMMFYISVQCILDSLPVSVSTEPVYSDDQFTNGYFNPFKLYISEHDIIFNHPWLSENVTPHESRSTFKHWHYHCFIRWFENVLIPQDFQNDSLHTVYIMILAFVEFPPTSENVAEGYIQCEHNHKHSDISHQIIPGQTNKGWHQAALRVLSYSLHKSVQLCWGAVRLPQVRWCSNRAC